ncbi:MAG: hypothetical protein GC162_02195 [Planctomycetes bacterium]|nr:hypothetical protein [Planctomycetota bacterium]
MKSLAYLNGVLTVLAVLLALQLWTSWTSSPDIASPAYAQGIPDEGAQRNQIIDQLKLLNQKTEEMKGLLLSGKISVKVTLPAKGE